MSYNAGAQRVPAWKRLGLKLKGPAAGEDPISAPSSGNAPGHPTQASQQRNGQNSLNASPASALKRKPQAPLQTPSKKIRLDHQTPASAPSTKKSVKFADDTKEAVKPEKEKKPKQPKKKKEPKKKDETPKADFSLEPALTYLRQWHTARESWKFNKNHQTLLIKYLFDADKVPSADIPIFYQYIRDLKGFVRTRLRETAQEIKKQDMEQGVEAFPASVKDKEEKQKEYEAVISDFLKAQQEFQQQRQQNGTDANRKRTFDEVELVIRVATPEVKQRLYKRIRAEMVLDELSDSENTISTDTTMTTTSTTSSTADKEAAASGEGLPKRAAPSKPSDGPTQPAKRRRLRKVRTDISDDESSSDSSSDDDSDSSESEDDDDKSEAEDDSSSSSSSDSDSDSDEEMVSTAEGAEGDESSSSSSSSSSESESEPEASDDEKGAEDSSSSESSDSDSD
ncbi:hypothetical protein V8F20_002102 [Naviculisporaceae sp. PSN 640]